MQRHHRSKVLGLVQVREHSKVLEPVHSMALEQVQEHSMVVELGSTLALELGSILAQVHSTCSCEQLAWHAI